MRVLLVNECPTNIAGSGGVEIHVRQLCNALQERGVQAGILASQLRGLPREETLQEVRIPAFRTPPLRKRFVKNHLEHRNALKKARRYITELRPDVIHIHNLMDPGALHMLRTCNIPVIKSTHDCRPFCVKPPPVIASRLIGDSETFCDISLGLACWRRCYAHAGKTPMDRIQSWSYFPYNLAACGEIAQADHLIVYSRYLKKLALRKMSDPQRIHEIPLFTAAEQAANPSTPKPKGMPRFLFAGRLSPEKGILKIFDALDRIPEVSCNLTIAGDGPIRSAVEQRIQHSHPRHEIEMTGYLDQPRLYDLYRNTSVLLFPSIGSEGCPLAGIEAMYFGATAIAFDTGGVEEWLVDGKTGILLPRGDVAGLANAIAGLASSPLRIEELGREAQCFVQQKFNRSNHLDLLIETYKTAIQNHRSSAMRSNK